MSWWKNKSLLLICLSFFLAVLVWSQILMYLVYILLGNTLENNLFTICLSLFEKYLFIQKIVSLFLDVLITYTIVTTIKIIGCQYFLLNRFKKRLSQVVDTKYTYELNRKFNRDKSDILVIQDQHLHAFTIGFRNPKIIISTGIIELLEENELNAVIEHETSHQINRDTLMIFALQLISQSIWFIPLTKWAYQNYKIISELLADQYATYKTGSEAALGSALLKLIQHQFIRKSFPVMAHFSDESINYRLEQLVNPHHTIPVKIKTASIIASLHMLVLMTVMMLMTIE